MTIAETRPEFMRGCRHPKSIAFTWFATTWFATIAVHAQSAAPGISSDLPAVIESLGADDPPDLPTSRPTVDAVSPPYLQRPARGANERSGGSVLDTLDNLPPVGSSEPRRPSDADPAIDRPLISPNEPRPEAVAPSRVVRFGDVRSESKAREQFPELRTRASNPSTGISDPNAPDFRPDESTNRPRNFLARLMPWRRPSPAEPPLITPRTSGDVAYKADRPTDSGQLSRVEVSDRLDSELQKKADRSARQLVGSRTNELDVQVVNQEVYIRARPMWFWQRRQITDDLRNLPGFESKRLHVTVY